MTLPTANVSSFLNGHAPRPPYPAGVGLVLNGRSLLSRSGELGAAVPLPAVPRLSAPQDEDPVRRATDPVIRFKGISQRRIAVLYRRMLSVAVILGAGLVASFAEAADQQVVLMLGGESCEKHMRAVRTALKGVEGVKSVDLASMQGHAIVLAEAGHVKPEQLTAAVGGVKGTNWHCIAEVMK